MMGDKEATTRTAKTPIKRIPRRLPAIENPVLTLMVAEQA
jgi:hypothetical protein